jgi:hypothetical protein
VEWRWKIFVTCCGDALHHVMFEGSAKKKKKCPNDVVDFFHVAGDFLDKLKMGDLALLTIIARGIWL